MQQLIFIKLKYFFQLLISVAFAASIGCSDKVSDLNQEKLTSVEQVGFSNFDKEKDLTCEEVSTRYKYVMNKFPYIGRKGEYKEFFTPKLLNKAIVNTMFSRLNSAEMFFTDKELKKLILERKANLVEDLLVQDCNWYDSVFDLYSQKANRLNLWINEKTLSGDLPLILQSLSNEMSRTAIDKLEKKLNKNWLDMTFSEVALSPEFPRDILQHIKIAGQFQVLKIIYADYQLKKAKFSKYPYKKYTDKVLLNESILLYKENLFTIFNETTENKYHTYLSILMGSLDAHSSYTHLTKETENDFKNNMGSAGLGVVLSCLTETCFVERVLKQGASFGKLKKGDLIVSANSIMKKGMSQHAFISFHLKGEKGSLVNIQILRLVDEVEQALNISIKRNLIQAERFQAKLLKNKTAYIKLAGFYGSANGFNSSSEDFIDALIDLEPKAESLIIDLRNNPGGHIREVSKILAALTLTSKFATDVEGKWSCGKDVNSLKNDILNSMTGVSLLLLKGEKPLYYMPTIAQFIVGDSHPIVEYYCNQKPYFFGKTIVVLINKGSASASEILSLGLKESGFALILGDKFSFGKGSGQSSTGNGSLKLTTLLWGSFLGKSIQFTGVESDIVLDFSDPSITEEAGRFSVLEKDIPRALPATGDIAVSWWEPQLEEQVQSYYKGLREYLEKDFVAPLSKLSQERQVKKREEIQMEQRLKEHSKFSSEENAEKIPIDLIKEEALNILEDLKELLNRKNLEMESKENIEHEKNIELEENIGPEENV